MQVKWALKRHFVSQFNATRAASAIYEIGTLYCSFFSPLPTRSNSPFHNNFNFSSVQSLLAVLLVCVHRWMTFLWRFSINSITFTAFHILRSSSSSFFLLLAFPPIQTTDNIANRFVISFKFFSIPNSHRFGLSFSLCAIVLILREFFPSKKNSELLSTCVASHTTYRAGKIFKFPYPANPEIGKGSLVRCVDSLHRQQNS